MWSDCIETCAINIFELDYTVLVFLCHFLYDHTLWVTVAAGGDAQNALSPAKYVEFYFKFRKQSVMKWRHHSPLSATQWSQYKNLLRYTTDCEVNYEILYEICFVSLQCIKQEVRSSGFESHVIISVCQSDSQIHWLICLVKVWHQRHIQLTPLK